MNTEEVEDMEDNRLVLNGILCKHDIRVDDYEENTDILFLHNLVPVLGHAIEEFAERKPISFSYFVSDTQMQESELIESLISCVYGAPNIKIASSGHPYSEVTPDMCWNHYNEFYIGGHNIGRELSAHVGKWLFIRVEHAQPPTD